ncbi:MULTISPECIES: hypothetical protein [unclassified Mesorhizobium]|uniref:hypothetical protein n=1 Tax=unclassified Mesorhizobium TaxID=325217 RepID=UPI000BAF3D62|nr:MULTISPECIES: hypothetical protein [unclassified Mesorhizobium]TGT63419.1 hypothetical protein EN813_008450 [Mesorhizobium sp. M00.F.Ca.ET.170.01.1.1]AZO11491.1 hypothetical protein EJ074_22125 [Mesorhizobium sp. M3A.F.Ca.ET.080.04.2.1]PBB88245.1 hypothetical protein CK216_00380 [Mesorhizobium sp. WSM3876]RWB67331.1 MAG: hypothetical protein EOQ49_26320 [Mesorhizobium sp.]RWB92008.1 MAG: hypothetical protein EOQ52_00390 [Mesorhizobium sp.]
MLSIYTELRKNAFGILLLGMLFAFGAFDFMRQVANDASPIRSVESLGATIKSVQWDKGSPITYVLFLDSGATVLINEDRPQLIGSHANIERVTRNNGFVFYRFPE